MEFIACDNSERYFRTKGARNSSSKWVLNEFGAKGKSLAD